jgi:hypothetical protein
VLNPCAAAAPAYIPTPALRRASVLIQ